MCFNLGRPEHVCRQRGGFREKETAEGVRKKEHVAKTEAESSGLKNSKERMWHKEEEELVFL